MIYCQVIWENSQNVPPNVAPCTISDSPDLTSHNNLPYYDIPDQRSALQSAREHIPKLDINICQMILKIYCA